MGVEEFNSIGQGELFPSFKIKSKSEIFYESLIAKCELNSVESEKYNFPLKKEYLVEIVNSINNVADAKFNASSQGTLDKAVRYLESYNPAVSQMLLTFLSSYSNKSEEELLVSDLFVLKKSLDNIIGNSPYANPIKRFRKAQKEEKGNNAPFGEKQVYLINEFFEKFS